MCKKDKKSKKSCWQRVFFELVYECKLREHSFESIVYTKIFSRWSGMDVPTIKGVIGSLVKKGLITLVEDIDSDDRPMNWMTIDQNQFELIKQVVAE